MDMWTIFAIALGAMAIALVLAYVLKSRLSDEDVWQELVEPEAGAEETSARAVAQETGIVRDEDSSQSGVETMPSQTRSAQTRDVDLRRSSRVEKPVQLIVLGTNRQGESFQERTAAVSFNLHGCRYSSRHDCPPESWVTLQVTGTDGPAAPVRARIRSVSVGRTSRELCQVGVELEKPANIWGIGTPPEDWQRLLGSMNSSARASAAVAPAQEPQVAAMEIPRPAASSERRAEVAVFPSPAAPEASGKTDRVTFTPEQLLQALQGKLQLAAERAVETALAERLDESVKQALATIEEGWKANLRQTEEFSAARLAEVQSRWERELVVYRSRAEEIARRVETLAASSRQGLEHLQKFAERFKTEVEPRFDAHIETSLARVDTQLDSKGVELAEQLKAEITQMAQFAATQGRAQLDEIVAEMRSLASAMKAPSASGVSEERLESLMNSSRESTVNRMEERLSDVCGHFEQQQDQARHRADEIAQHVEMLTTQLNEAKAQQAQSLAELRSAVGETNAKVSPELFEPTLKMAKEQIFNHLEWRLGEVGGRADQQHNAVLQRAEELNRRLEGLMAETAAGRSTTEQSVAELRTAMANGNNGVSQQRLDEILNSVREQLLNHFEWRLGEVSGEFQREHEGSQQRTEEMARRFETLTSELREQLAESRTSAETLIHELRPHDLSMIEQSVERAGREFEIAAARISDRQLVRLMQQKQALSTEASLELEARASETRALLQKAANSALDDFRHRVESQIDLVIAESTERVASSMAALDAESRAACENRRREVELHVARAAEQSTAEFRSGIKAFLYSCLVAAVSAVDEHAQSTMTSLGKTPLSLEAPEDATDGPPNGVVER